MAIIALRAWYIEEYEPIREVLQRPHDLRLSKNSMLKSGMRVDFLDEREDVRESRWFQRYLEGETVEFYVEGSGGYTIANIDLISHEIYLTKRDLSAWLDPVIYCCYQSDHLPACEALQESLHRSVEQFNQRSRHPLSIEESLQANDETLRLSSSQLKRLRKCLLFVADGTAIATAKTETRAIAFPSPNVCIELGYALESKQSGQILLVQMERPELEGQFPFNLPKQQQLLFRSATELNQTLPQMLETLLQRFNLLR